MSSRGPQTACEVTDAKQKRHGTQKRVQTTVLSLSRVVGDQLLTKDDIDAIYECVCGLHPFDKM